MYFIDTANNGSYKPIEIDEKNRPEPIQGKDQWMRDFYGSITYPAIARRNGIGGVVILDIAVDQKGKVTDIGITQGVSTECDHEARRAYVHSVQGGYIPLTINGVSTKFRMELPVEFRLQ